ncbi:hypothetical protein ACVWXL_007803 [Bradyrhizobium sp. GM22.5]
MPSGARAAIGIANVHRKGSIKRNKSSMSGIDDSRNPSGSRAKENAVRQTMTSNGLLQLTFCQREASVGPPSVMAEMIMLAANTHIRMPV